MQDRNDTCISQSSRKINVAPRVFLGTEEITLSHWRSKFCSTKPFG